MKYTEDELAIRRILDHATSDPDMEYTAAVELGLEEGGYEIIKVGSVPPWMTDISFMGKTLYVLKPDELEVGDNHGSAEV